MGSHEFPLSVVNNPLVYGVYNVYNPNGTVSFENAILTEASQPLLTEAGTVLLIE